MTQGAGALGRSHSSSSASSTKVKRWSRDPVRGEQHRPTVAARYAAAGSAAPQHEAERECHGERRERGAERHTPQAREAVGKGQHLRAVPNDTYARPAW
jgi:hypothetical protein